MGLLIGGMYDPRFFDTEFTELSSDSRLISIGLVSEDGRHTLYAELSDTYRLRDCSEFVREVVLQQPEGGAVAMTMHQLAERLSCWLHAIIQKYISLVVLFLAARRD